MDQEKITRDQLNEQVVGQQPAQFAVRKLALVDAFSSLFAEWELKEKDILVHLFPRAGENDVWSYSHYLLKCRKCGQDKTDGRAPCPRCGHTGLVYIQGRAEYRPAVVLENGEHRTISFPDNMKDLIKQAADKVWAGDIAIEMVEELGAYVVQFQNASYTTMAEQGKIIDEFLTKLDSLVE